MQGGKTARMWFDFVELVSSDLPDTQPVGQSSRVKIFQKGHLIWLGRHDDLAADLVLDPVLSAEVHHRAIAFPCQRGLQASRLIVDSRMDHSAIVARLMFRPFRLLFQHHDAGAREKESKW